MSLKTNLMRTWVHHTGMQLATVSVLTATMTIISCVFVISSNLRNVLSVWGESIQISAYLHDETSDEQIEKVRQTIQALPHVGAVHFVSRTRAAEIFKTQMANYAPDLLQDKEFLTPFPASFLVGIQGGVQSQADLKTIETLAERLRKVEGVEDVSFGQGWVSNYSAFADTIHYAGWVLMAILIFGGLLVVGNSVRSSIHARRDEIEILELVGASSWAIRSPFIFEGVVQGVAAAVAAISINLVLYTFASRTVRSSLVFSRLGDQLGFLSPAALFGIFFLSVVVGGLGAYICVRQLNDGWAASQRFAD